MAINLEYNNMQNNNLNSSQNSNSDLPDISQLKNYLSDDTNSPKPNDDIKAGKHFIDYALPPREIRSSLIVENDHKKHSQHHQPDKKHSHKLHHTHKIPVSTQPSGGSGAMTNAYPSDEAMGNNPPRIK